MSSTFLSPLIDLTPLGQMHGMSCGEVQVQWRMQLHSAMILPARSTETWVYWRMFCNATAHVIQMLQPLLVMRQQLHSEVRERRRWWRRRRSSTTTTQHQSRCISFSMWLSRSKLHTEWSPLLSTRSDDRLSKRFPHLQCFADYSASLYLLSSNCCCCWLTDWRSRVPERSEKSQWRWFCDAIFRKYRIGASVVI